jgi:hypothetical protein
MYGQLATAEMLADAQMLISMKREDYIDLVDRLISWYTKESIDEEWNAWEKELGEEETKKRKQSLRLLLFFARLYSTGLADEVEILNDIERLNIPKESIEYLISKLKDSPDFKAKSLSKLRPTETNILGISWRHDARRFLDSNESRMVLLEIYYSDISGEKKAVQFDLNIYSVRHLISLLKKIEGELCQDK